MENGIFEILVIISMADPYTFGIHKHFKYSPAKKLK